MCLSKMFGLGLQYVNFKDFKVFQNVKLLRKILHILAT